MEISFRIRLFGFPLQALTKWSADSAHLLFQRRRFSRPLLLFHCARKVIIQQHVIRNVSRVPSSSSSSCGLYYTTSLDAAGGLTPFHAAKEIGRQTRRSLVSLSAFPFARGSLSAMPTSRPRAPTSTGEDGQGVR